MAKSIQKLKQNRDFLILYKKAHEGVLKGSRRSFACRFLLVGKRKEFLHFFCDQVRKDNNLGANGQHRFLIGLMHS